MKTVDSLLERYLIANFKSRQFIDLRAHNFADFTVFWSHKKAKFFS